ncbi:MAG TPA: hypothetical protein VHE37_13870, partial [Nevskiaceae bacterium]|nr:hypothetical protein [Nevskiaceae bacterium]
GLDWANRDWGVNLQLPYLQRSHGTLADGDTDVSSSDASGMGDMRITARYQGFFADRSFGVMAGVKLATGDFHQTFESGPQAGGALDRGLQRGTGTTDGIIGVYHYTALSRDWDLFEQAQFKGALGAREDFRPGNQWIANVGLRYVGAGAWIPQAQLNYKHEAQESGAQADQPNSGSDELYLSPGLAWRASRPLALYGFVQLPLYRRYTGLQLAPEYSVTTGVRYSF